MLVLVLLLYEYQLINVEICVIFSIFAQIPNWTVSILEIPSVRWRQLEQVVLILHITFFPHFSETDAVVRKPRRGNTQTFSL